MTDGSKQTEANESSPSKKKPASSVAGKFGLALILLSGVFFFSMIAVPWMPLSGGQKVIVAGALFVGVQVAWWVGAALAGPAVVNSIRSLFRRKK